MSGRRGHPRFVVLRSPEGVLRVLKDVVIQSSVRDQTIAVSSEPGIPGEIVTVQVAIQDAGIQARVLESQPIVVDGGVRHQLRLHHVLAEAQQFERDIDVETAPGISAE